MFETRSSPDPTGLSEVEQAVVNSAGQIAAAQCRWLLALADLDPSGEVSAFYSVASWLSWRCSIHIRTAAEYVKVASALKELPRITGEFSSGRLSYSQVKLLARVATAGTEEVLLYMAQNSTVGQLARVVGSYRAFLESEADTRARNAGRSLSTWFDEDGFFVIRGRLCPEEGAVVERALQRVVESMPAPPRPQATVEDPPGDVIDHYGARKADGLAQMAREYLAAESQDQRTATLPEVVLHVDFDALAGAGSDDCHLDNGVALAPDTALRLACDAAVVPLIQDAKGNPLSVGRRTRSIPVGLRRALRARDKGCRFPGCTRNRYLQGHHVHHWSKGGETSISNTLYLCHFHHKLVHEGGYGVTRDGDDFVFYSPEGTPVIPNPTASRSHSGTVESENARNGVTVEPYGLFSGWDGERMRLEYVMGALAEAYEKAGMADAEAHTPSDAACRSGPAPPGSL